MKKNPPNNPLNGNGLVQLTTVGNSIRLKWVKSESTGAGLKKMNVLAKPDK